MSEQSGNSGVRPEELTVSYRDASVHVKANGRLRTYVRSSRNAYSELAGQIRSTMIIALALMEALTIYGLLIAFMLVARV